MPETDAASKWGAITTIVEKRIVAVEKMAVVGAALKYHQFVLHAGENPVSPVKLEKMEQETFRLLSQEDRKLLDEAHAKLPPHKFFPLKTDGKGRDNQNQVGNLDDLLV